MGNARALQLFALSAVIASSAVSKAHAEEIPEAMLGSYRFTGGNSQRQSLTQELDRVADQFGFFIRGIARRRMHAEIRPEAVIVIERRGGRVMLLLDERRPVPCDGGWHPAQGANEEEGTGMCRYENGRLRFEGRFDEGRIFYNFAGTSGGQGLRMNIRVTNPQLPDAIRYGLSYRR